MRRVYFPYFSFINRTRKRLEVPSTSQLIRTKEQTILNVHGYKQDLPNKENLEVIICLHKICKKSAHSKFSVDVFSGHTTYRAVIISADQHCA